MPAFTFEMTGDMTIRENYVLFTVLMNGQPHRAEKYDGAGRWLVIARDALHDILKGACPGLRKVKVPRQGRDECRAWQTVLDGYRKQAQQIFEQPRTSGRKGREG